MVGLKSIGTQSRLGHSVEIVRLPGVEQPVSAHPLNGFLSVAFVQHAKILVFL